VSTLSEIVESKRYEVETKKRSTPIERLRGTRTSPVRDFAGALSRPGMSVIAEIKKKSPSRGVMREAAVDVAALAREYAAGGAAALSVLTDGPAFGGCDEDLKAAREATVLPVLRKDFTVDEYQIHEALAIGADAILLIVRILTQQELPAFLSLAEQLGLAVLTEVHNADELARAVDAGARIIGINNRDLDTLAVDVENCLGLRRRIPPGRSAVAESGIRTRVDVSRMERAGFDAVLVGESLMTSASPKAKLRELLGGAT
jgi:indole-3-glycerol phosphate synthase